MVTVATQPLADKRQTGAAMYRLVESYYGDLGPLAALPLAEWFSRVRAMPYRRDPRGAEVVARPRLLLTEFPELDCKKKSILMASWLRARNTPFRFVAVSERGDRKIHHVFVQAFLSGKWRNIDATYEKNRLFAPLPKVTRAQELRR